MKTKTRDRFAEFCATRTKKAPVTRTKFTGKNGLDKPKLKAEAEKKLAILVVGSAQVKRLKTGMLKPVGKKRQARAGKMLAWHKAVNARDKNLCQGCRVLPGFTPHAASQHGEHLIEQGKSSKLRLELGNGAAACAKFNAAKNEKSRKDGRIRGHALYAGTGMLWHQWYWTNDKCIYRIVDNENPITDWVQVRVPKHTSGALMDASGRALGYVNLKV